MAMSTGLSGRRPMAEINITPFTDVCLVLLIIFMISASFLGSPKGMDVKLPSATQKATDTLELKNVTITVAKDGSLYLDDKEVSFSTLYTSLKDISKHARVESVIIKADQGVLYDQVVKVMDAVRETGISTMSLAVQQEPIPPIHRT